MLTQESILGGKYRIQKQIGQGGMSSVYLAENRESGCRFALKEIRRKGRLQENFVRERLISEKEILKQLSHPGIVKIIDVIDCQSFFYLIMSYVEGMTLEQELKTEKQRNTEQILADAMQICEILGYLHSREKPILYQDLKPSNLIRKKDGRLVLIDFGTAREYCDGDGKYLCLGTKGYAAPEQYLGNNAGAATDIHAFGKTILQLLTGKVPWMGHGTAERNVTDCRRRRLYEIAEKCSREDPSLRYASCAQLYADLVICRSTGSYSIPGAQMLLQKMRRKSGIRRYEAFMKTYGSYEKHRGDICENYRSWEEILIPMDAEQCDLWISFEQPQVRRFSRSGIHMEKEICCAADIEQIINVL
ncbi:MAG: serine/threonine protein kinase [Butyrivibrio sp.]|nr:serine/threonine protein kinase [Butyrivibrio sp.]